MIKLNKLNFLTAGFPSTTKGTFKDALQEIKKLELDGLEMEFVHSIWLKENILEEIKQIKNNLVLTAHAPYYINLATDELPKYHASINRIVSTAKTSYLANAYSITFHAGFYLKDSKVNAFNKVNKALKEITNKLKDESIDIWLRPETTGKESQIGDLEETIKLSENNEMVLPCIDFAHLHARYNGLNNTKEEWTKMLNLLETRLGRTALDNMHIHLSGINYTPKGERNHLILKEADLNWKELLNTLKDYKIKGALVCESPNIEIDTKILKNYYG